MFWCVPLMALVNRSSVVAGCSGASCGTTGESHGRQAAAFPAKAKSVIFLYMVGGPSHIDTFDPKPALEKYNGQPLPPSYGTVVSQFTKGDTPLLKSPWAFQKYGQCGREVSTLFPHMAQCVDDMCFVKSFYTESTVHAPAMYQVNTGRILMGLSEHGFVITYGLGSESDNLPSYVVMPQPEGTPEGGTPCWGAGFLPLSIREQSSGPVHGRL